MYTVLYRITFLLGFNAIKLLPFPGGLATQISKFVLSAIPEDSEDCDAQPDRIGWSNWDRDDYNYALQARDAGGRQGAGIKDPLSEVCDNLLNLKLETSLPCCMFFQYQYQVMFKE
jgi:hypothetical protein